MNSNGKDTETTLLNNNQEIILTGSISKLYSYTGNDNCSAYDCINIFNTYDFHIISYYNLKSLLKFMNKLEESRFKNYLKIHLLVADELKIITLMETMSIGLLEAIYLLHIENKEVDWQSYK